MFVYSILDYWLGHRCKTLSYRPRPSPSDIATNYDGGKWLCLLRLLVDSGLPISPGRRGENEKKVVRHDDICVSDLSVYMFIYTHLLYYRAAVFCFWKSVS